MASKLCQVETTLKIKTHLLNKWLLRTILNFVSQNTKIKQRCYTQNEIISDIVCILEKDACPTSKKTLNTLKP